MKTNELKTAQDVSKFLRGFYDAHVTALNGVMDKLPDALKGELKTLRDSLNQSLSSLPPMDQVPAAQEAAWAFQSFGDALVRMQEYASGLLERMTGMKKDLDLKAQEVAGWMEKEKTGELVPKATVKTLCDAARGEGSAAMKPEIAAARKGALELAGLPVASDDVLGLPAAEYEPRLTAAKDQIAKLGTKGLKIGGKGDKLVRQLAWLTATEFAGQMGMIEDVLPTAAAGAGAGAAAAGKTADPLLGNPGAAGATGEKDNGPLISLA